MHCCFLVDYKYLKNSQGLVGNMFSILHLGNILPSLWDGELETWDPVKKNIGGQGGRKETGKSRMKIRNIYVSYLLDIICI